MELKDSRGVKVELGDTVLIIGEFHDEYVGEVVSIQQRTVTYRSVAGVSYVEQPTATIITEDHREHTDCPDYVLKDRK